MVDFFALALSHGLLALAVWRLVRRADLDRDPATPEGDARPDLPRAGKRARRA